MVNLYPCRRRRLLSSSCCCCSLSSCFCVDGVVNFVVGVGVCLSLRLISSCAYLWVAVDVGNYNEKNEAKPDTAPKRRKTENVVRVLMFLSVVVNLLGGRGCCAHAPVAFLLSVLSLARWSVLDQS